MSGVNGEHVLGKTVSGECPGKGLRECPHPMQDYKFLHRAVMICDTVVNTHIHTQRERERGGF